MDATRPSIRLAWTLALVLLGTAAHAMQPPPFSSAVPGGPLPPGWVLQPVPNVPRQTRFDLVGDGVATVLRARADASAASLRYTLQVDPARDPQLRWRWKTEHVLDRADLTRKSGDDYAARLYVFFDRKPAQMSLGERALYRLGRARYGDKLPAAALCYVWDNRQPVDTLRNNAYTGFVKMMVASSGKAHQGQWTSLQRDVAADYRRAFNTAAPAITGVAIMVDTDNTGEAAVSYFGDVSFGK